MQVSSRSLRWLTLILGLLLAGSVFPQQQTIRYASPEIRRNGILSVVMLFGLTADNKSQGGVCSGTYIGDGLIITDFHCIGCMDEYPGSCEEKNKMKAGQLYHPKGWAGVGPTISDKLVPLPTYIARMVSGNYDLDIAILKIFRMFDSDNAPASISIASMNLADSNQVRTGDTVFAIGYPSRGKDTITFTGGYIAGILDEENPKGTGMEDTFKLDVEISPGNSGGLLMDDNGKQIGITYGATGRQGQMINAARMINCAVPYVQQAKAIEGITSGSILQDIIKWPTGQPFLPAKLIPSLSEIMFNTTAKKPDKQITQFPAGTKAVFGLFDYQGMQDSTNWGYAWYLNDQLFADRRNSEFWKSGHMGKDYQLSVTNNNDLPQGNYKVEVYYNGALRQKGSFVVGTPGGVLIPKPPEQTLSTTAAAKGRVIDANSKNGILNAWVAFLKPGKTMQQWDDLSIPNQELVLVEGYTDFYGYFATPPGLTRGTTYTLVVTATGYERRNFVDTIKQDDPNVVEYPAWEMRYKTTP